MSGRRALGLVAASGYVGTVLLANWLTSTYGLVGVGFALTTTAGTYAAGLALGLRDAVQDTLGKRGVLAAVLAGAVLSSAVASHAVATASAVAFLLGELADFAVYTPLRERSWVGAVIVSNVVGGVIDTYLFLSIAGFPTAGRNVAGQLVGKGWATVVFLGVGVMVRAVSRYREQRANQVAHA